MNSTMGDFGICVEQSDTGEGFSLSYIGVPLLIIVALFLIHICHYLLK
jgi:predicted ABC-type sugar transport system permease subunit